MKKSNKGFMLLETLIVSTFILGTLIFLYVQFSAVKRTYDVSFRYNTVPGLYYAKEVARFLKEDGYAEIDKNLSGNNYINITNCTYSSSLCSKLVEKIGAKTIIYVGDNIENLKKELNDNNYDTSVFDQEFKRFVLYLDNGTINRNRIIIEYNDLTFATVTLGSDENI